MLGPRYPSDWDLLLAFDVPKAATWIIWGKEEVAASAELIESVGALTSPVFIHTHSRARPVSIVAERSPQAIRKQKALDLIARMKREIDSDSDVDTNARLDQTMRNLDEARSGPRFLFK
jgi:hypothetical protein